MELTEEQGKQACERIMNLQVGMALENKFRSGFIHVHNGEVDIAVVYSDGVNTPDVIAKLFAAAPDMLNFMKEFILRHEDAGVDLSSLYYAEAITIFNKATK